MTLGTMRFRLSRKILHSVGAFLEIIASIGLVGWLQASDPDCILDTGVFMQLRMCDPAIVGEPTAAPLFQLSLIVVVFLAGFACHRFAAKSDKRAGPSN